MNRLKVGDLVIHFKHEKDSAKNRMKYLYIIKGVATHTETGEKLVIYSNFLTNRTFARPYYMFMSLVDKRKYPDIKQIHRMEKVD